MTGEEKSSGGGPWVLAVRNGSMRFLLNPGDLIRVERAEPGSLRSGDIVVFIGEGRLPPVRLVVHRLVRIRREGDAWRLWTRGDSNDRLDESTSAAGVLGKVTAWSRPGGPWRRADGGLGRWRHRAAGLAAAVFLRTRPAARAVGALAAAAEGLSAALFRLASGRRGRAWRCWRAALTRGHGPSGV